ncbi:hypothetical protein [Ancylobacter sp.]|uniref:hypothetical protein n=1 Tax=Ancylobacter sp. TaxID=1872567 RepID=UPI003D0C1B06
MLNAKTTSAAILAAMLALSGPALAQTGPGSGGSSPGAGATDSGSAGGSSGIGSNSGGTDTRAAPAGEMNPAAGNGMGAPEGRNTTTGTGITGTSPDQPANADRPGDTKSDRDCTSQQTPC